MRCSCSSDVSTGATAEACSNDTSPEAKVAVKPRTIEERVSFIVILSKMNDFFSSGGDSVGK